MRLERPGSSMPSVQLGSVVWEGKTTHSTQLVQSSGWAQAAIWAWLNNTCPFHSSSFSRMLLFCHALPTVSQRGMRLLQSAILLAGAIVESMPLCYRRVDPKSIYIRHPPKLVVVRQLSMHYCNLIILTEEASQAAATLTTGPYKTICWLVLLESDLLVKRFSEWSWLKILTEIN